MLRWTPAAVFALAATPSQALVQLESSYAYVATAYQGSEDFEPGLGTSGRSFDFNNIGGCEGADETGEPCGGYESSGFSLTLTDNSFDYEAALRQQHDIVPWGLSTDFYVIGLFRADREMRLRPQELRSIPYCVGGCSNSLSSSIWQYQEADGSWRAFVEAGTYAATRDGRQQINHHLTITLTEVPEPQAWALMIAGFGLVGAAQRRRRAFFI